MKEILKMKKENSLVFVFPRKKSQHIGLFYSESCETNNSSKMIYFKPIPKVVSAKKSVPGLYYLCACIGQKIVKLNRILLKSRISHFKSDVTVCKLNLSARFS